MLIVSFILEESQGQTPMALQRITGVPDDPIPKELR